MSRTLEAPLRWWERLLGGAVYLLIVLVVAVSYAPAWVAWLALSDEELFPHPGERMGLVSGAAVYYVGVGSVLLGWWFGWPYRLETLMGAVSLLVVSGLLLWRARLAPLC